MPFAGFHLLVPIAVIAGIAMLLAHAAAKFVPFYRSEIDKEVAATRYHAIDGLRGFLALAVMFHHAVITHFLYSTGQWQLPPSHIAIFLGRGGVALFFMITAFLFWSRALREASHFDVRAFYWGRIRRMVPMYATSTTALIVTVLCLTHFQIRVPMFELLKEIVSWMSFPTLFGLNINAYPSTGLVNTVYWSLAYEWMFYLAFPLLLLFTRGPAQLLLTLVGSLLIVLFSSYQVEWYFITGMAVAALSERFGPSPLLLSPIASLVVLAFLGLAVTFDWMLYDWLGALIMLVPFYVIANGNTMFGVLTCRCARLLGMISYSLYLIHNFVLYLGFRLVDHVLGVVKINESAFWAATAVCAIITIALSMLTFRYIESPALRAKLPAFFAPRAGVALPRVSRADSRRSDRQDLAA